MIFTTENSIFDPEKLESYSLDRPISDYYINSSFRSHLAYDIAPHINQPTRGYIYLLQKGVRHFDLMITVNITNYFYDESFDINNYCNYICFLKIFFHQFDGQN